MELQRFGKLLLELSELSVDEKSIIFIQLAKDFGFCVEAKKDESAANEHGTKPKKSRKEYTNEDMSAIEFAVGIWNQMSDEARTLCVHDIARRLGRTNKAIRYQITSRLK